MIDKLIDDGYISKRKHPQEDLYILNYTPKTQYEGFWNDYTTKCRGLIVDENNNVKARCFNKFFNYEQVKCEVFKRSSLKFEISEKLDGSLGILYWLRDKPFIATRGSFESEQALKATQILHDKYKEIKLNKNLTYLFEIIYPENRICVNYGDQEDLVLLSIFETESGLEIGPKECGFPVAPKINFNLNFEEIKNLNLKNKEGFVIKFEDGFRFKIKFEDYVLMHDVIFSVSSKSIWNSLRNDQKVPIDQIPDEIYSWIKSVEDQLKENYNSIKNECDEVFKNICHLSRKEFATEALKYKFSSVLFNMLDKKAYKDIIWKLIEPEFKTPKHEEI